MQRFTVSLNNRRPVTRSRTAMDKSYDWTTDEQQWSEAIVLYRFRQVLGPLLRGILHAPSLYWTGGQSLTLMDINWPNGDIYHRTRSLLTIVFMTRPLRYLIPMSFTFTYFLIHRLYTLCISEKPDRPPSHGVSSNLKRFSKFFHRWRCLKVALQTNHQLVSDTSRLLRSSRDTFTLCCAMDRVGEIDR